MQLIATDNNLDSSLSLYKQTKQLSVGQCGEPIAKSQDICGFLLKWQKKIADQQ